MERIVELQNKSIPKLNQPSFDRRDMEPYTRSEGVAQEEEHVDSGFKKRTWSFLSNYRLL